VVSCCATDACAKSIDERQTKRRRLKEDEAEDEAKGGHDSGMKPTEKRRKTKPEEEEPQEEEGAFSLAFPSFGTGVFQYDKKRAAQGADMSCAIAILCRLWLI